MSDGMQTHLTEMRRHAARRTASERPRPLTFAERAADGVAAAVGSWRFIVVQTLLLIGWVIYNANSGAPVDPFPFILLNLLLSFQAAYTAPIIMMSQNRQEDLDRARSIADFEINRKAELEIETLHHKIDVLREQEIASLVAAVDRLTRLLEATGDEGR